MSEFIPSSFFIEIPGALYNFIYNMFFFIFRYQPLSRDSFVVSYLNPFTQDQISYSIPYLPEGFNSLVVEILDVFGINSDFTFFELICSSFFIVILVYGFIKYIKPI